MKFEKYESVSLSIVTPLSVRCGAVALQFVTPLSVRCGAVALQLLRL